MSDNGAAAGRTRLQLDDGRFTFGIGAILLLAYTITHGILVAHQRELDWGAALLFDWMRDLGIAFIVGGIVSLGIERISRQRFLSEAAESRDHFFSEISQAHSVFLTAANGKIDGVKTNFFNAAVLRHYPSEFSRTVLEPLESAKYFKKGLNITVDLMVPKPDERLPFDDAIYHEVTSSYHAFNIDVVPLIIQPRMFLDLDWDDCPVVLLEWRVGDIHLDQDGLKKLHDVEAPEGDNAHIWYKFPAPVTIKPGESALVLSRIRTTKHRRDTTTWCGIQPADSLRFVVNHPPDFEAYIQQKTSSRSTEGPVESDGKRVSVDIFKPLMPYMTMEYGWRPRRVGAPVGRTTTGSLRTQQGDSI